MPALEAVPMSSLRVVPAHALPLIATDGTTSYAVITEMSCRLANKIEATLRRTTNAPGVGPRCGGKHFAC